MKLHQGWGLAFRGNEFVMPACRFSIITNAKWPLVILLHL
jgi:hypothetical protein